MNRIHFHRYWTGVRFRLVEVSEIRQRSTPPWDFRFFVIRSYVTTTNIRAVGLVLTVLNHFHLFPSGPLAQSAEGHLLCSAEQPRLESGRGQSLSGTQGTSVAAFAPGTTVGPQPRSARSTPGEPGRAADRQVFQRPKTD